MPYFTDERAGDPHAALYWRMALRGSALREGDWKLLRPNSQLAQLYDLSQDASEQRDLIAEHPEVAARLLGRLNDWEATLERNPLFISSPYWLGYNRRLYDRRHALTQPGPDSEQDHWSFAKNRLPEQDER